jgi:hypothetical protein
MPREGDGSASVGGSGGGPADSRKRKFAKDLNVFGRGPREGAYVTEMDVTCTYIALVAIVAVILGYTASWHMNTENHWVFSFKTTEYHYRLDNSKYYDDLYTLVDIIVTPADSYDDTFSPEITGVYDYTINDYSDDYISCNKVGALCVASHH